MTLKNKGIAVYITYRETVESYRLLILSSIQKHTLFEPGRLIMTWFSDPPVIASSLHR